MSTAEELVKDAEQMLLKEVFVPVVLQKCAERGIVPANTEERQVIEKVAMDICDAINAGAIAPAPTSAAAENGQLSKEASEKLSADPLAYINEQQFAVKLDEVAPHIKEAAAVIAWAGLEEAHAAAESNSNEGKK